MDVNPRTVPISVNTTSVTEDTNETSSIVESPAAERWSRLPKPRGRQPRDPNALSIRFECRDVDDVETQLRDYLESPTAPAEHAILEFSFPTSAAFMVYSADFRRRADRLPQVSGHLYGKLDRRAVSVIDALAPTEDSRDQMRRQKAIAKTCVEACEKADGYRYSFHNSWMSREDEAYRFSYFCNDSTLNKGRAANEGAGTTGKKMRKPVYDCQGLIAVKFSAAKQSLEVHYKHVPIHKTYNERAPPPRRDSKRYKLLEIFDPENLPVYKRQKVKQPDDTENPKKIKNKSLRDTGSEAIENVESAVEKEGSLLLDLLEASKRQRSHSISQRQPDIMDMSDDSMPLLHEEPTQLTITDKISQTGPSLPDATTDSSRQGHISGGRPVQNGNPKKKKQIDPPLHGIVEASTSVAKSEFEILKAKLEEAEERIKKLESEKNQPTQTWPMPPYPYPPPNQYPYPYGPPHYPYPPSQSIPPQSMPPHVYPQHPYPPQQPYSQQPTPATASATTVLVGETVQAKKKRSGQSSKRDFITYVPKSRNIASNQMSHVSSNQKNQRNDSLPSGHNTTAGKASHPE